MRRIAKEMAKSGKQFIPPQKKTKSRKPMCTASQMPQSLPENFKMDVLARMALLMPPMMASTQTNLSTKKRKFPLQVYNPSENVIDLLREWSATSVPNFVGVGVTQSPVDITQLHFTRPVDQVDILNKENLVEITESPRKRRRTDLTLPPPISEISADSSVVTNKDSCSSPESSQQSADVNMTHGLVAPDTQAVSGNITPERTVALETPNNNFSSAASGVVSEGVAANISPPGGAVKKFWEGSLQTPTRDLTKPEAVKDKGVGATGLGRSFALRRSPRTVD